MKAGRADTARFCRGQDCHIDGILSGFIRRQSGVSDYVLLRIGQHGRDQRE